MTVGVVIVTHEAIGKSLLHVVRKTFANLPNEPAVFAVRYDQKQEDALPKLAEVIRALDDGDGVLILTDIYGATPYNLVVKALPLIGATKIAVLSGVNLPMLMKIMNYADLGLDDLVGEAISGAKAGVLEMDKGNKHDQ